MKMSTRIRGAKRPITAGLAVAVAIGMLAAGPTAFAAGPPTVGLGTAASFAVLAGTPDVTNTGPSSITGDLGIAPAVAVTGFPPGTVSGTVHKGDAVALQAKSDLVTAYTDAAGRPVTATHGTLGGLTLASGVYTSGGVGLDLTGTLTLDGQNDATSVWIFKATSSLVTASNSAVKLINGASACNVFWQVTSSATLGSGSTFVGTIMALTSITMQTGVTLNGRALARNGEVTLINDTISSSSCSSAAAASPSPSASASPSASPSPSPSPSASASPSPSATPAPTATVAPIATTRPTIPPTSMSNPISADPTGNGLPALFGVVFLAALSLMAASRRYRTVRNTR
jgi:Ice-binding-like